MSKLMGFLEDVGMIMIAVTVTVLSAVAMATVVGSVAYGVYRTL